MTDVPITDPSPVTVVVGDVAEVTVATVVMLLVHVPPATALLNIMVDPEHTAVGPVIAPGTDLTVTVTDVVHPVADEVNCMTVVPGETPVTSPPAGVTVATPEVELVQVPTTALLNCVVDVGQTVNVPTIAAGVGLTVTVVVAVHPFV